ncbi:MAG: hypothetical protein V4665_00945 [Patescibacteria group bacterium]
MKKGIALGGFVLLISLFDLQAQDDTTKVRNEWEVSFARNGENSWEAILSGEIQLSDSGKIMLVYQTVVCDNQYQFMGGLGYHTRIMRCGILTGFEIGKSETGRDTAYYRLGGNVFLKTGKFSTRLQGELFDKWYRLSIHCEFSEKNAFGLLWTKEWGIGPSYEHYFLARENKKACSVGICLPVRNTHKEGFKILPTLAPAVILTAKVNFDL